MPAPARRALAHAHAHARPAPVTRARPAAQPSRRPSTAKPQARPKAATRGNLRVVDPAKLKAAHARQRRARALAFGGGLVLVASLLATAASHALLVSGQAHLDSLQRSVADEQARYSRARLRVAQLEAPEHIVREAQERLGMVPPSKVTYLTPSSVVAAEVGAGDVSEPAPTSEGGGGETWAAVKPYLATQAR